MYKAMVTQNFSGYYFFVLVKSVFLKIIYDKNNFQTIIIIENEKKKIFFANLILIPLVTNLFCF